MWQALNGFGLRLLGYLALLFVSVNTKAALREESLTAHTNEQLLLLFRFEVILFLLMSNQIAALHE